MSFWHHLHDTTPIADRFIVGGGLLASLSVAAMNSVATLVIACLTILVMIPRVVIAWREMLRKRIETKIDAVAGEIVEKAKEKIGEH